MEQFCREIGLPEEAIRHVMVLHEHADFHPDTHKLRRPETWDEGLLELKQEFGEDPLGYKMLCAQLRCAMDAWKDYEEMGFSRQMYVDTMAAFSRFVKEHLDSFGTYGFDRDFWTVRQISCTLFRIGQLEYELIHRDGEPVVSMHIPSDADLSLPDLRASYLHAREILNEAFPVWSNASVFCQSWLLSLNLKKLLPESSRILGFQRSFRIEPVEQAKSSVLLWVYKNRDIPIDELPEDTSLQRSLKTFLKAGGEFHDGRGYLVDDPFIS